MLILHHSGKSRAAVFFQNVLNRILNAIKNLFIILISEEENTCIFLVFVI